jgi:formylmethanofuran dehydrogenase subunit C
MTTTLQLHTVPPLRLDLRALQPSALAAMALAEIEALPLGLGRGMVPLAEFFHVTRAGAGADDPPRLVLQGDCSRCDRIGWLMAGGEILIEGAAGDEVAAGMQAGRVRVQGPVRDLAACEMAGGELVVEGNVGDFAASARPGSMDGMRGGSLIVHGRAGQRFADRMRRGTVFLLGDAGDFFASRLVAGTIAVAGRVGAHPGFLMRRGSLVFAGAAPALPETYVPAIAPTPVAWQLLARSLQRAGARLHPAFEGLAARPPQRWLGDTAAGGRGEWLVCP